MSLYLSFLIIGTILFLLFVCPIKVKIVVTPLSFEIFVFGIILYRLIGKKLYQKILGSIKFSRGAIEKNSYMNKLLKFIAIEKFDVAIDARIEDTIKYAKFILLLDIFYAFITAGAVTVIKEFSYKMNVRKNEDVRFTVGLSFNIGTLFINYLIIRREHEREKAHK